MLEDTSFAIHPGSKKKLENSSYHDIGDMKHVEQNDNVFKFHCELGQVNVLFYRSDIVRVVMNPFEEPTLKSSPALVKEPEKVTVSLLDGAETVTLTTKDVDVSIQKSPFRLTVSNIAGDVIVREGNRGMGFKETSEVICYKEMEENDHFYGFGEKSGFLDKRGEKMTMWNTDVYAPHNPETDSLYQSIPYFMTIRNGKAHGIFFDNTFKTTFDLKSENDAYSFMSEGGQVDYYVLAGPTPKEVIEQYTDLTGRMTIPPKWAIGYHQSRYSYETEQEVRELANTFIEKKIPIDVIYLDIHYMNEYRVFTFDRDRFPTPEKMVEDLRRAGIRIVPIVDPGVKKDPEYKVYQEGIKNDQFCKYIEGDTYFGDVWPGESAFPDFTNSTVQKWWGENHKFYTDLGIEGIWNDMNEPSVFNESKTMDLNVMHDNNGDMKSHRELHNLYGLLMGKATFEGMREQLEGKRPFLLTRSGYSGVQRYAAVWTGDNRSFWEHLQMSLPMCMNLGVSGIPFCGPDVGGFAHDSNGQLLARWTQVGAFTPYFRNHCAIGFARQEPWSFGEEYEAIVKKYIELRYKWLPHLYTLFAEASKTGIPVMRPLLLEYPDDQNVTNMCDQFMIGDNVIIAPIMTPDTFHRVVYLPEGNWVDYWTGETKKGCQHMLVQADLQTLPIFVKEGSYVAQGAVKQSTEVKETDMTLQLYAAQTGESSFTLYEDDGSTFAYESGAFLEKSFHTTFNGEEISIVVENKGNYVPEWSSWTLSIQNASPNTTLFINEKPISLRNENGVLTATLDD